MRRDGKSVKQLWQQMLSDKKEEGELLMITDLLKNDLNRLETPSARVIKLRAPLLVPGLLHQYSLISVKLKEDISMAKTMKALFPGGSITGAPKKRVMEIIGDIERYQRGIYCGSTLLCLGNKKAASINIRTASINIEERIWRYGAGGGITLLSRPVDEFKEMEDKVSSFLKLLKISGF
jgi:anthranilate/para-aminobenzoate synthase component I